MTKQDIELNIVANGTDSLRNVSVALRSLAVALQDNVRATSGLDARQRGLGQALGVTAKGFGDHAKSISQAVKNQTSLSQAIKHTSSDLSRLKRELAMGRGGSGMASLVKDLEKSNKGLKSMKPRLLVQDLRGVSTEMKRLGKDAQFVGRSLIIGLTAPIVGFASKGLASMVAVERQITRLTKIVGQEDSLQAISTDGKDAQKSFRNLGFEIPKTIKKIDAINIVLKQTSLELGISRDVLTRMTADFAQLGVSAASTLASLSKTAAEVSILGDIDLSASQELTQTLFLGIMRALDQRGDLFESAAAKQARAAQLVTNQIFLFNAVENATSMSFENIAQSLPELSAAVVEFGLSFMEGLALVAPIKAAGIQVSVGANAIKMSLQRLTAPTSVATKHIAALKEEMKGMSPAIDEGFENIFSIGTVGLQALIDITAGLNDVENGAAKSIAMFSKLFDKRQSTRMKIAVQDLGAFQREMNSTDTALGKLILKHNERTQAIARENNVTLPLIKNMQTISVMGKLPSAVILEGKDTVSIAGQEFTQSQIDAAKKSRKLLQEEVKEAFRAGENIAKTISQESGKVLFTQLVGVGGAQVFADAELKVAKESIAITVDRVKIALKELSIIFINELKPVLEGVTDGMMSLLDFFNKLDPFVKKAIIVFASFVAAVGPLVFIFGQVKLAFGVVFGSLLKLLPGMKLLAIESIASNSGLLRLRKGLTMTAGGVHNTNGRFVTLIGTLAGGGGPISRFADKFGRMTGILKNTRTAASDVISEIEEMTVQSRRATDIPLERATRPTRKTAQQRGFPILPTATQPAIPGRRSLVPVPETLPNLNKTSDALDERRALRQAGITPVQIRELRAPIEAPSEIFKKERFRLIKEEGITSEELRESREFVKTKSGRTVRRDQQTGRFRSLNRPQEILAMKMDSIEERAGSRVEQVVDERRLLEVRANQIKKLRAAKVNRLQHENIASQVRANLTNKNIIDQDRTERLANLTRRRAFNEDLAKKRVFFEKAGIDVTKDKKFFFKDREITRAQADRMALGGMRGRATARGLGGRERAGRLAPIGRLAAKPFNIVGKVATAPVKGFKTLIKASSDSVKHLNAVNAAFGNSAPGIFKKSAAAVGGFNRALALGPKLLMLIKVALIGTGIGAIIVGIGIGIVLLIKNFEKIKKAAAPIMAALRIAFDSLRSIVSAIMVPIKDFFAALSGGEAGSENAMGGIASGMQSVADFITKAALAVESFVSQSVVPFLTLALSATLNFIQGVKGVVSALFSMAKGGEGAFEQLKESAQGVFDSIVQFAIGTLAPALVRIIAEIVKIAIKILFKLVEFLPLLIGIAIKLFMEFRMLVVKVFVSLVKGALAIIAHIPQGFGIVLNTSYGLIADFVYKVTSALHSIPIIGDGIKKGAEGIRMLGEAANFLGSGITNVLMVGINGIGTAIDALVSTVDSVFNAIGDGAISVGKKLTDLLGDAMEGGPEAAGAFIDDLASQINNSIRQFRPGGMEAAGSFWEGFGDRTDQIVPEIELNEDVVDPDSFGDAGEDAAKAFAEKFKETIANLKQKFVDLVLGIFESEISEAVQGLVDALDKQRDAAMAVYEDQLETIGKLEKAQESLMRQREHIADRSRILDERELNRQNFVRNRALAIYEGRIDDARMLDLEERKSKTDSARSITDIDEKRNKDLAAENLDFIKEQIKKTKEESDKFFKDQIDAFKEAAKQITKFAPNTIEEYEEQLNALTDLARKTANDNGVAFAETFQKMTQTIQTQLPNIGSGVFSENLQTLIDIARQKYGLESPSENSIVGATVAMLESVSQSVQNDGLKINASMDELLQSMKNDVVDKALDEINLIIEDKNPHKVLEEAITTANETIRREFARTVGHVASEVDGLADSLDPFIIKIAEAQLALEALREAASKSMPSPGGGGDGSDSRSGASPGGAFDSSPFQGAEGVTGVQRISSISAWLDNWMRTKGNVVTPFGSYSPLPPGSSSIVRSQVFSIMKRIDAIFGTNPGITQRKTIVSQIKSELTNSEIHKSVKSIVNEWGSSTYSDWNSSRLNLAIGGSVPGYRTTGVPAMLHGGEFVVSSKAVSNIGLAALQSMNNMKFSTPGKFNSSSSPSQMTETNNYNIYVDNFIGEDQWFESMMKTYNMKVVPRNQKNAGLQSRSVSTYSGINRGM